MSHYCHFLVSVLFPESLPVTYKSLHDVPSLRPVPLWPHLLPLFLHTLLQPIGLPPFLEHNQVCFSLGPLSYSPSFRKLTSRLSHGHLLPAEHFTWLHSSGMPTPLPPKPPIPLAYFIVFSLIMSLTYGVFYLSSVSPVKWKLRQSGVLVCFSHC